MATTESAGLHAALRLTPGVNLSTAAHKVTTNRLFCMEPPEGSTSERQAAR